MSFFRAFRFRYGQTWLHTLDPRVKILFLSSFLTAFLYLKLYPLFLFITALVILTASAKIVKEWLGAMKGGIFFVLLIIAVNLWVGFSIELAIAMAARFVILLSVVSIFFLTTRPEDLAMTLEGLRVPDKYVFMLTTSIRCIPTMAMEALTIMDAQRSRGLELEKGSLAKRAKNFIPIIIPLIINAIRRSLEMAEAMEARAWGATKKRTNLHSLKIKSKDYVILLLTTCAFFLSIYSYAFLYHVIP